MFLSLSRKATQPLALSRALRFFFLSFSLSPLVSICLLQCLRRNLQAPPGHRRAPLSRSRRIRGSFSMRIRKQQRDRCMADFNCAGALHLLAAASVSNNVVHAAHEAAAVLQLQTSVSDVDAVEPMIIQDEKKKFSFGDSQVVKVEGEASSSVSDYGGSTKRIREDQAGIKWIGVGLDSKKLQQKAGKMETSSNKLSPLTLLSSKITSDSSYLDIRSSCSVQQQTLQISSCRSRSFPQTEPRNGGGNSSSEEKGKVCFLLFASRCNGFSFAAVYHFPLVSH